MRRIKKTGILLLVLFLLMALVIAALPLWFPWVLRPAMARAGVGFGDYERVGYGRFVLTEVAYRQDGTDVDLGRVETYVPTAWLWNLRRHDGETEYVFIEDWRIEIVPKSEEKKRTGPPEADVTRTVFRLEEILARGIAWLPRAAVGSGEVRVADRVIEVKGATWREGELTVEARDRDTGQTLAVEGDVGGGLPFQFQAVAAPFPLEIELTVEATGEGKLIVRSDLRLAGNPVTAEALFPREGFLPEAAHLRAEAWRLSSDSPTLEGYGELQGSAHFEWLAGAFSAELRARAYPEEGWENRVPPLRVEAVAGGDLETFRIETLDVRSPWVAATLSAPVAMNYRGELLSERSVFDLTADLAEQPFVELDGRVRGRLRISPGEERFPEIDLRLSGERLAGVGLELTALDGRVGLRWPELTLERFRVRGADGSEITAEAMLNLETREIAAAEVAGDLSPGEFAPWLPEEVAFSRATFSGSVEGPVARPRHRGRLEVEDLRTPGLRSLDATATWDGTLADLASFEAEAVAGAGRVRVTGSTDRDEDGVTILLKDVRLERGTETLLAADGESRVRLDWAGENLRVSLGDLLWAGPSGRELRASGELAWPNRGAGTLEARKLNTDLLADFLEPVPTDVGVTSIRLNASWADGPLDLLLATEIEVGLGEDRIAGEAEIRAEEGGLHMDRFRAMTGGETLLLAEGVLPISIWPGEEAPVVVRGEGEVDFRMQTDPRAGFWERLAGVAGVRLIDPHLRFEVRGTASAPEGHLTATLSRIGLEAWAEEEQAIPKVEDLRLEARFQTEAIRLQELNLRVEGQRLEAEGVVPMGPGNWRSLVEDRRLADWEGMRGRIRIPGADLAAFSRFAPTILSPQGTLTADIGISAGGFLDGFLRLDAFATRPLMPVGTLRDGTVRLEFDGRVARIGELSGTIGGERVTVTGEVGLPLARPLTFDLALRGENLPLARQPGMVIRADLDLAAVKREEETPLISGAVTLRDSFYLAHLKLMPGGGVATPEKRPPFFSVDQAPFADWELDVALRGPGFLNIRGPIFQGLISAGFDLSGTLEEPVAIGAATIDEGRVRFPFATLEIDQGEIALRPENPFQPQLFVVSSGMTFGYDLTMEITGTAEKPLIEFMANPPLTSEQALLMVTTGELPRQEMHFSTQQRASRFALYFGQNLLYELTGDDSAGNRLTIRSGEQVSEGGRETTTLELKLTDRWSVLGEYDRFDEYNVGLKWKIYSR